MKSEYSEGYSAGLRAGAALRPITIDERDFLSPVPAEREAQEEKFRQIFPGYPDRCAPWQCTNALLDAAINFKEVINALRGLHDEQNCPPLEMRRKQWQAAMYKAIEVLQKYGA